MTESDRPVYYGQIGGDEPPALAAALLPGSFNPLHDGHLGLAQAAGRLLGVPVAFELSAANVDKPELADDEIARRVSQFRGVGPVWVTRAATFAAKAELFPGVAFVLGHDTAVRLIDPRYYADVASRDAAMRRLLDLDCRVVVGGRVDAGGAFRVWGRVSAGWGHLFAAIPEAAFRADVSSTAIRSAGR